MFDKKAFFEAVKEPLRLLVLAIVPFILAYFEILDAQWAVILTALLRGADRYLHEIWKLDKKVDLKGLVPF